MRTLLIIVGLQSFNYFAYGHAVAGPGKYFDIKSGYLDFDVEKGNRWIDSDSVSNQAFVVQKDGTDEALSDYLNMMISAENIKKPQ